MPMLRITMTQDGARLHDARAPLRPALRRALAAAPGPVTVMVHGYKYLPGHPIHCPHDSIFSQTPRLPSRKVISWPRRLGLRDQPGEGLGLSIGWSARGTIWDAYDRAEHAGTALAGVLSDIRTLAPDRSVHLLGHSLGARVALCAIRDALPGAVTRAVLLAAAVYGQTAQEALGSEAGRKTQVLNVTSRENDFYDFLMERLVAPTHTGDRMLGHGSLSLPNMVTLQLDDPQSLAALSRSGFPIAQPTARICHWSPYLRSGVFALYRAYLSGVMPQHQLRALLPVAPAPRWSRLMPFPQRRAGLRLAAD